MIEILSRKVRELIEEASTDVQVRRLIVQDHGIYSMIANSV
jgi:hypothetical protein